MTLQSIVDIYSKQKNDTYLIYLARKLATGSQSGHKLSEILKKVRKMGIFNIILYFKLIDNFFVIL
ncbi:hypothetical protein BUY39_12905 [Staphylococcus cohnii]|nr:hypothetical protein BUY39_12905 [Staphylococcus cohnii]